MRVLAIAETDSYTKWAAWTLESLPHEWTRRLVVLSSHVAPSDTQIASAVEGSSFGDETARRWPLGQLLRLVRRERPDVVLLACTGPTVAALTPLVAAAGRSPLVVSGVPGVALPVRDRAVAARAATDVFIAHSRRERSLYARRFRDQGTGVATALASLPFLGAITPDVGNGRSVVFAAQPSVPPEREQRLDVLRQLAGSGCHVTVKLRTSRPGEQTTHREMHPYPELWDELKRSGEVTGDELCFVSGSFFDALSTARSVVTVSSTAALEAIRAGVPVRIVDDYGVSDELINSVFVGSGTVGPISQVAGALADVGWMEDNYFHPAPENDFTEMLMTPPQRLRKRVIATVRTRRSRRAVWNGARRLLASYLR